MKNIYDHTKIEKKWQKEWEKEGIYHAKNNSKKKKFYSLIEFPYPSGDGLHVGHPRPYIGMDIISRKRRMEGYNVLYPIGWDAFGLPTENYAIKTGISPEKVTKKNTDTFRKQIQSLAISFDWSREINTTDPKYYKWTQWIFLQFFKQGLAYKAKSVINWCPKDKTGLANEEVVNGCCERCGTPVIKKEKEQWMMAITKYAERLDKDLDTVDYLPQIKAQQRNWIGKSEGSEIGFNLVFKNKIVRKILIGTRNEAKFKMVKECLPQIPGVEFVSLNDIEAVDDSSLVEGMDYVENAKMKSEFYHKATGLSTISLDNVFWLEKWDKDNGIMVHMRKEANPKSDRATDQEVITYLKSWVKKVGGKSKAHFMYAVAFTTPMGTETFLSTQREYILQEKEGKNFWPGYPAEALLIDAKTKEYKGDQDNKVRYNVLIGDLEKRTEAWFNPKPIIPIFTTRADTIYGATYMVLAPDHPWVTLALDENHNGVIDNADEVRAYVEEAKKKTEIERTSDDKDKIGVEIKGVKAINPASKEEVSIWVADYVLSQYGTGAIMAVPAHDERDYEFAKKYNLPIKKVIDSNNTVDLYIGEGKLINSGKFDGMNSEEARKKITEAVGGKIVTKFKLRDWIFSRQRYWGEPIPLIHCDKCGYVPVPDKDLPVKLPKVKSYVPTDNGESPLAEIAKWVNVKCPRCKGNAKRETDTMPNWAGSSWYYLRYTDQKNNKEFASEKNLKYWTPVDWYNGGMEHTTLHLLYSRFWHKFLYDQKLVPTSEPYMKRTSHGMILAEGGEKMSKSRGNVVNPDEIVKTYGSDTLRVYEMFMGPFDQAVVWSTNSIIGPRRFLEKVWKKGQEISAAKQVKQNIVGVQQILHKTIKKVTEDIETMSFNTAISAMMVFMNEVDKEGNIAKEDFKLFLQILAPFAPHICDELWRRLGENQSIHQSAWPLWDKNKIIDSTIKIAIQVNGKVRTELVIDASMAEEDIKTLALSDKVVEPWISGKEIKRVIYVKGRLVNIVL